MCKGLAFFYKKLIHFFDPHFARWQKHYLSKLSGSLSLLNYCCDSRVKCIWSSAGTILLCWHPYKLPLLCPSLPTVGPLSALSLSHLQTPPQLLFLATLWLKKAVRLLLHIHPRDNPTHF